MELQAKTLALIEDNLRRAKAILYTPEVTLQELEISRGLLLENQMVGAKEDHRMETILGKIDLQASRIYTVAGDISNATNHLASAKTHFYTALAFNPTKVTPHFGLFKIAVIEEDYQEAFFQLQSYDTGEKTTPHNFELAYQLLGNLLEKEVPTPLGHPHYIQTRKVEYQPISLNYQLAEAAFKNGDYARVLKHLEVCQHLSTIKNVRIDFSFFVLLASKVFEKQQIKQVKFLKNAYMEEKNAGNRMVIAQTLVKLDRNDIDNYFLIMDSYIDLNVYSLLDNILNLVKKLHATESQKNYIHFYEKLIKEKQQEELNIEAIQAVMTKAKQEELIGNDSQALAWYQYGIKKYGLPYFQVKQAKLYYKSEDYETALKLVSEYLKIGYFAYEEASILLYKIYRQMGNTQSAIEVAMQCYHNARIKERGRSLNDWMTFLQECYSDMTIEEQKATEVVKVFVGEQTTSNIKK